MFFNRRFGRMAAAVIGASLICTMAGVGTASAEVSDQAGTHPLKTVTAVPGMVKKQEKAAEKAEKKAEKAEKKADKNAEKAGKKANQSNGSSNSSGPTETKAAGTVSVTVCANLHHTNTGHGANVSGPYNSTCDGSPSKNGNGAGKATGKPCAGCVGNADSKNPKGQMPNGKDKNKGYECDKNNGIGKGNPAHSACKTSPATDTSKQGKPDSPSNQTEVKSELFEHANSPDSASDPAKPVIKNEVLASHISKPQVKGKSLAHTGANIGWSALAGLALLLSGIAALAVQSQIRGIDRAVVRLGSERGIQSLYNK